MKTKGEKKRFFILCLCLCAVAAAAQDYDYHKEESPAISWNGTQMFDARMLAAGGVSFMASAPFSAVLNPALTAKNKGINAGFSFDYMHHEAFQYWGVNQGVTISPTIQSGQATGLSGFTLSVPLKKIRLSAGCYRPLRLALPDFDFNGQYWQYTGTFKGKERHFFAAAAVSLGKRLDLGVKVDYIDGKRNLEINEYYKYTYPVESYLLIQRKENHSLDCLAASLGATFKLTPGWTIGTALVYPFEGHAKRTIDRVFDNQYAPPIFYSQNSKDPFYRPVRILFGTIYSIEWPRARSRKGIDKRDKVSGSRLTIAAEATYVFWSGYQYIYFSEEVPRDMRNCLILALGCEYGIFRTTGNYFFRAGYRRDPQPVRTPGFILHALTFGTGFRYGKITMDFGMAYYTGPSDMITQHHSVISGTLSLHL